MKTTVTTETMKAINMTIEAYNENAKAVKMNTLKDLCDLCGITPAKNKAETINLLVDLVNNAENTETDNNTTENTETATSENIAVPAYSKNDVKNASYRTLKKIAEELSIEYTGTETMTALMDLILNSGKLKNGTTTRRGSENGINAERRARRDTFIHSLKEYIKALPDCEYSLTQKAKDENGNEYYTNDRIGVKIAGKVRFTIFAQNKAMNIATRPETVDEINADILESGFDIPVYEYGHLDYGKQSAFIKGIEYPDPNTETDITTIDGTKYYLLPALLVDLFRLYGIEHNTVPVNLDPDVPEMVPTENTTTENDSTENTDKNTENTENGNA